MDKQRFVELFGRLCVIFREEPTEALLAGYWDEFRHYETEAFDAAVRHAIRTSPRFPVPQVLYDALEGSGKAQAFNAWKTVGRAVGVMDAEGRTYGRDHKPSFHDPKLEYALECVGGWKTYCDTKKEDLKWLRRDFIDAYIDAPSIEALPRYLKLLSGGKS